MLIVGFVFGSVFEIIPGLPMGYDVIVCCADVLPGRIFGGEADFAL